MGNVAFVTTIVVLMTVVSARELLDELVAVGTGGDYNSSSRPYILVGVVIVATPEGTKPRMAISPIGEGTTAISTSASNTLARLLAGADSLTALRFYGAFLRAGFLSAMAFSRFILLVADRTYPSDFRPKCAGLGYSFLLTVPTAILGTLVAGIRTESVLLAAPFTDFCKHRKSPSVWSGSAY